VGYSPMHGVPMVASAPVRGHEVLSPRQHPVDVRSYEPPWKALCDFALNSDLDRLGPPTSAAAAAHYQQLVNQVSQRRRKRKCLLSRLRARAALGQLGMNRDKFRLFLA